MQREFFSIYQQEIQQVNVKYNLKPYIFKKTIKPSKAIHLC